MQSLVTSSSAFTSSAVRCFTAAPGSKLNTCTDGGTWTPVFKFILFADLFLKCKCYNLFLVFLFYIPHENLWQVAQSNVELERGKKNTVK